MSDIKWFSIEKVGSCPHTAETRKIQAMVANLDGESKISFSAFGKRALVEFAIEKGFPYIIEENGGEENCCDNELVQAAYNYLEEYFSGVGTKAGIMRAAIAYHAESYNT